MRVIEVREFGGPEVLVEVERDEPRPEPGRVLVRVGATGVSPTDWFTRSGVIPQSVLPGRPPFVLGWDVAGTVLADAGDLRSGQRVVAMIPWFDSGEGSYAEAVAVDLAWLAPLPDGTDLTEAGTLPLNGLTARQGLDLLGVPAGGTLLVTGASGGVGGFAVQLAAAAGVDVVAVASVGDDAFVGTLGAKEVLVRTADLDIAAAVRRRYPDGVDGAYDAGSAATVLGAVRDGGGLVAVTPAGEVSTERGITVAKVSVVPDAGQLTALAAGLADGSLRTRVHTVLPLADAAEAHRRGEAGGFHGRLVLVP